MNINRTGLSKAANSVLDSVDRYLSAYKKGKNGGQPEKLAILKKDYESLYKSATKGEKDKPKKLFYNGILLYPL